MQKTHVSPYLLLLLALFSKQCQAGDLAPGNVSTLTLMNSSKYPIALLGVNLGSLFL